MMGSEERSKKLLPKEGRTRGRGEIGQAPESCYVAHGGRLDQPRTCNLCTAITLST